jgi:hypothetical protein
MTSVLCIVLELQYLENSIATFGKLIYIHYNYDHDQTASILASVMKVHYNSAKVQLQTH